MLASTGLLSSWTRGRVVTLQLMPHRRMLEPLLHARVPGNSEPKVEKVYGVRRAIAERPPNTFIIPLTRHFVSSPCSQPVPNEAGPVPSLPSCLHAAKMSPKRSLNCHFLLTIEALGVPVGVPGPYKLVRGFHVWTLHVWTLPIHHGHTLPIAGVLFPKR